MSVCCSLSAFAFPLCLWCLCLWFDNFLLSLVCARVCFVPSMLLLRLVSLFVLCVCLLVCLLVCSLACLFVKLVLCMRVCLLLFFVYVYFRFVFALCCRVRLLFVFVVALFGSALHLMGPGHFSQE